MVRRSAFFVPWTARSVLLGRRRGETTATGGPSEPVVLTTSSRQSTPPAPWTCSCAVFARRNCTTMAQLMASRRQPLRPDALQRRNCSPTARVEKGAEAQVRDSGADNRRRRNGTPVTDATEDQAVTRLSQVNRNGAGGQPRRNWAQVAQVNNDGAKGQRWRNCAYLAQLARGFMENWLTSVT